MSVPIVSDPNIYASTQMKYEDDAKNQNILTHL